MGGFTAGLVAGCLLGVCGTFFLLTISAAFSVERASLLRLRSLPGTVLSLSSCSVLPYFAVDLALARMHR